MGSQSGRRANRPDPSLYLHDVFGHSLFRALNFDIEIPRLYTQEKLSLKQIAVRLEVSRVLIRTVLRRAGIEPERRRRVLDLTGQTPFGWKRKKGRLVPSVAEQKIIGRMREARRDGMSLHAIARALTSEGVPTKNGGRWHAKSISQILECNARLAAEHKRQIGMRTELSRK